MYISAFRDINIGKGRLQRNRPIIHAERDLWIAVILVAFDDLTGKDIGYARDASDWVHSSEQHVGSFIWVCHLLGVEPTAIRRGRNFGSWPAKKSKTEKI